MDELYSYSARVPLIANMPLVPITLMWQENLNEKV